MQLVAGAELFLGHTSERLIDVLTSPKRLELLPGADHQFTKGPDFQRMTTLITEWLTAHLS